MKTFLYVLRRHPLHTLFVLFVILLFFILPPAIVILLAGVGIFLNDYKFTRKPTYKEPLPKYISAESKATYLQSPEWQYLRELVLTQHNHRCVTCGSSHHLQIHHITYERLGNEKLSDLTVLCNNCHNNLHARLGYNRDSLFYPDTKYQNLR